jgi:hypothetical protein
MPCGVIQNGSQLLLRRTAVRKQSCFLPQRHDPSWPVFDRLFISSPRNPVITGKSDQLLDVAVRVVPLLDHVRQIEWASGGHLPLQNGIGTPSSAMEKPRTGDEGRGFSGSVLGEPVTAGGTVTVD